MTDLLEELYMPIIEKETTLRVRTTEHHLSKISLINADDCLRIFDDYGHHDNDISLRVNRANISSDELVAAFLRGAFEGCGSVSDPMKSYHAEFCVPHKICRSICVKFFRKYPNVILRRKQLCATAVMLSILKAVSKFVICLHT